MSAGTHTLSGELTLPKMADWLPQVDRLAAAGSLDLSGITRADSAGLALLLELRRHAQARGTALSFTGAPPQLRELTDFFGLTSALAL